MAVRTETLPNTPNKQAIFYGPTLLAGALGTDGMTSGMDVNVNQAPYDNQPALNVATFVSPAGELSSRIHPVAGEAPLTFRTAGLGRPGDVTLIPLYRLHHQRYNLYWSVFTPDEFVQHQAALEAAAAQEAALDTRTLDKFLPGNQQSEVDHAFRGKSSNSGPYLDRSWRDAHDGGEFSFILKADGSAPLTLRCTYWGGDTGGRVFDVLIDGTQYRQSDPGQQRAGPVLRRGLPDPPHADFRANLPLRSRCAPSRAVSPAASSAAVSCTHERQTAPPTPLAPDKKAAPRIGAALFRPLWYHSRRRPP